jgi:glutathione S-transferase
MLWYLTRVYCATRFALSYKGLPFVTVWVEYSEIAIVMKSIGAKQIKRPDGSDVYTVPVISDPNTGALITDSMEIASYLEKTYPEKPIFPHNSEALIRAFYSAHEGLRMPASKFVLGRSAEILSPDSAKFFMEARCKNFKLPWDEFTSEVRRDAEWELLEKAYNTIYEWYQKTSGKWIMGDTFSYADIIVACSLLWYKRVLRKDEWARISSWNEGKWVQLLTDVEKECNLA